MTIESVPRLRVGPLWIEPRVVIYATLIQMTAYAVFDVPDSPIALDGFGNLIWVAVVPMFALAVAHAFSELLDLQIRIQRRMNWAVLREILHSNLQFLYVSLIPIILIIIGWVIGMNQRTAVNLVLYLGIVSLALWGGYGARSAGMSRWTCVIFGAGYASLGALVVALEVLISH